MSAGRIVAVGGRILSQLAGDKRAMALILIAPMLVMGLFAILLNAEERVPKAAIVASGMVAIYLDKLEEQLEVPDEDTDDAGFEIVAIPEGMEPKEAVLKRLADAVLVFPDGFLEDRASGRSSQLDLYVEGADPMRTAGIFSRFRKTVPDSLDGMPRLLPVDCAPHCADSIPEGPPKLELTKVYGDEIDQNMDFFAPVLPPFFVFFFVFLLSGITFLRERMTGTAERLLASPLQRTELVSGYVLGFLPAAVVQGAVVILFARYVVGGPWGGWTVILSTLLMCLVAESLGVFVSAFARSEFQVFQFIPIVVLPQLLLAGIIWPVSAIPAWLRPVAYSMPLTYAVEAIRDAAIRQLPFTCGLHYLGILCLFALGAVVLAAVSVRRSV